MFRQEVTILNFKAIEKPWKPSTATRHCVKLLGHSLMARDFERQVAEFQIRAAVLNGHTALGIPVTEPTG